MPMSRGLAAQLPTLLRSAGVQPPVPLLHCANRGAIPNYFQVASAANLVSCETRKAIKIGGAAQSELRFVYGGYMVQQGTNGAEVAAGNTQNLQVAFEYNGASVQATFGGSASPAAIPSGAAEVVSDPVYPWQFGLTQFPAGALAFVRERRSVASGANFTKHFASTETGEGSYYSDGTAASQLLGTGAMSLPSGGAAASCSYGPLAIIGRSIGAPDIAVLLIGDSLADGTNDTNVEGMGQSGSTAGGGFMARALWSVNGRSVPFTKVASGGTSLNTFAGGMALRRALFKYHTHAWFSFGSNDAVVMGRAAAPVFADAKTAAAAVRGGDSNIRRVAWNLILNRCTTTDGGATVANQTPRSGFENGGAFRPVLNASLTGYVGPGGIDEVLDYNPLIADATQTDRWAAGASADGVHPTAATIVTMVSLGAGRVASWV